MKRSIIAILCITLTLTASAQPARSRVTQNNAQSNTQPATTTTQPATTTTNRQTTTTTRPTASQPSGVTRQTTTRTTQTTKSSTSRASIMFPTAVEVPTDAVWRRDIYRELDLTKDTNAPLYYPVEPQEGRVNLFTLLFQLLNTGKIPAYTYDTSGLENFNASNRMHFKDMLERYEIPFEVSGNTIKVEPVDIPSNEVLSYFVKESSYYDQHTATYHSRVVAICPVMHRSGSFVDFNSPSMSADVQKSPLFWVKMEDIEPYLSQQMVMTSNINNAATMSMADFFETNKYKGDIYMTTNMQGKSLAQMVNEAQAAAANSASDFSFDDEQYNDSASFSSDFDAGFPSEADSKKALQREQNRIEKEIKDFEEHIWSTPVDSVELARQDSIAASSKKAKKVSTRTTARQTASKAENTKKEKAPSSSGNAPRVSVRRERH